MLQDFVALAECRALYAERTVQRHPGYVRPGPAVLRQRSHGALVDEAKRGPLERLGQT